MNEVFQQNIKNVLIWSRKIKNGIFDIIQNANNVDF